MKGKNEKKNTFVAENACGSHFFCNLQPFLKESFVFCGISSEERLGRA